MLSREILLEELRKQISITNEIRKEIFTNTWARSGQKRHLHGHADNARWIYIHKSNLTVLSTLLFSSLKIKISKLRAWSRRRFSGGFSGFFLFHSLDVLMILVLAILIFESFSLFSFEINCHAWECLKDEGVWMAQQRNVFKIKLNILPGWSTPVPPFTNGDDDAT